MSIIQRHDHTLYGAGNENIVLRPLCDEHLPLLYRWNADPEVVYWSDTGNTESFSEEDVRGMYSCVSKDAFCFLAEVDGTPIGDFWLQRMNLPEVSAKFPTQDVRRIEATIGEKSKWGQGFGTAALGMLIDFAFYSEHADVLYCFAADYNLRSQKTLLRQGFVFVGEEALGEDSIRAKKEYHYMQTRQAFIERRRVKIPEAMRFECQLDALQPCRPYVSEGKLRLVREWFDPLDRGGFDPIPVREAGGKLWMLDGNARAAVACLAGWSAVPVYWADRPVEEAEAEWCDEEGVHSPFDLTDHIVPHLDYERLRWKRRMKQN